MRLPLGWLMVMCFVLGGIGLFVSVILLAVNWGRFGRAAFAKQTWWVGLAIVAVIWVVLPFVGAWLHFSPMTTAGTGMDSAAVAGWGLIQLQRPVLKAWIRTKRPTAINGTPAI